MRSISLALSIVSLVSMTACSAATSSAPDATSGGDASAPPALAGHWVSDCTPSPQADGSTQYFVLDFDLADARWDLDYVVHGDAACTAPLLTVHIAGPYALERPSASVEGAWEARFAFDEKTIRPEVDALRDVLNGLDGCGAEDFATGVANDVYTTGCAPFGQYPRERCEADYDLVRVVDDTLFFGARPADNDMCTAERRPTALSPVGARRQ
jgi:Adenomatosis polyposis coli down-regulated 1